MDLTLLTEKICSRMGALNCMQGNGKRKGRMAKEARYYLVGGRTCRLQRRMARKCTEAKIYHNAGSVPLKSAEKCRMGSNSRMVKADGKGRGRTKTKGSN